MLELMGAKYQDLIPRLITKTWFLLLRANHLVIARLVHTVASVLLTYTQIIARDMPPSHVNLINIPATQYQFSSTNSGPVVCTVDLFSPSLLAPKIPNSPFLVPLAT